MQAMPLGRWSWPRSWWVGVETLESANRKVLAISEEPNLVPFFIYFFIGSQDSTKNLKIYPRKSTVVIRNSGYVENFQNLL